MDENNKRVLILGGFHCFCKLKNNVITKSLTPPHMAETLFMDDHSHDMG